jgi:hypothetical protein
MAAPSSLTRLEMSFWEMTIFFSAMVDILERGKKFLKM